MRVAIGKKLRVGPGDEVIIRGRLAPNAKLGRLFVFASEQGSEFAPYALHVSALLVANGRPMMLSPLSLRLTEHYTERDLSFVADIDGYVRVMQEVDDLKEPRAVVKLRRKIDPTLTGWDWFQRKYFSWQIPNLLS